MSALRMTWLETHVGPVRTWRVGNGPPVVVLHGGPGLDHSYLVEGLRPLNVDYELIFFDQPGCGADGSGEEASLEATLSRTDGVLRAVFYGGVGLVIAHSWGTNLLMMCHSRLRSLADGSVFVLVCPAPTSRDRNSIAGAKLMSRLPDAAKGRLPALLEDGSDAAGQELMGLAMAAYCAPDARLPSIAIPYRMATFAKVDSDIGEYRIDVKAGTVGVRVELIAAAEDYIVSGDYAGLEEVASRKQVIADSGHFPMLERGQDCIDALRTALSL
jgi:pimeloyl-ACP methyl ester carboxylesterase